jgi:hypothetical protein
MIRDIFTNKWILGGFALLIIIAGGCYLWYQHTTAQYEKQAAETAAFARQWEINRKAAAKTVTKDVTKVPAENSDTIAEKNVNKVTTKVDNDTENGGTTEAPDPSKMSPFGLGPYPEIPKEWNVVSNYWELMGDSIENELLSRVTIKMHNEGIRSKYGSVGVSPTGQVIALERGSVLVEYEIDENGEKSIYSALAHPDDLSPGIYTRESQIPSDLKIVTADEIAFDAYEYLGLPK